MLDEQGAVAGVAAVAETIWIEGARILATLIRTVGDVQLAEDAVQEATLAAISAWQVTGVPPQPRAWLTVTARRKAIDILRREQAEQAKSGMESRGSSCPDLPAAQIVNDDLLRLIFTCCHPALSPATRVALALRTLCGLSPAQIAVVLLTTEAATTKRLTRARAKIAAAQIPHRVPAAAELADRLPAVCGVIHSLYTARHAPIEGAAAYDIDACAEAVRLVELLHELLPGESMTAAVLALLLLTEARRPARLDQLRQVVTLDLQDRHRWNADAVARGIALLNDSLLRSNRQADPYQLQAAIAAEPSVRHRAWPSGPGRSDRSRGRRPSSGRRRSPRRWLSRPHSGGSSAPEGGGATKGFIRANICRYSAGVTAFAPEPGRPDSDRGLPERGARHHLVAILCTTPSDARRR